MLSQRLEGHVEQPLCFERQIVEALPCDRFREYHSMHSVFPREVVSPTKLLKRFSWEKKCLLDVPAEVVRRDFIHQILYRIGSALSSYLVIAEAVTYPGRESDGRRSLVRGRHH
jgi:hypothetical protein